MNRFLKDLLKSVTLASAICTAILGYDEKNVWLAILFGVFVTLYVQLGNIKTRE